MKTRIKNLFIILFLLSMVSCSLKTIPPEKQYKSAIVKIPMKETYKLIRPCLIKYNYRIVDMDITVGAIKAVSKRNKNKHLYVTVSSTDNNKSHVKLKLDVRKHSMTGEYKRIPVPEKFMGELDGILTEIKRRAALMK
jgi:hypothetical protein